MSQTLTVTRVEQVVRVNPATQQVTVTSPEQVVRVVPSGPPGPPGPAGVGATYDAVTPTAQAAHVITHNLGRDPVAVQVFDVASGLLVDDYSYVVITPNVSCRIGMDIALQLRVRLA